METLPLLVIAVTAIIGSYLLVNVASSLFSEGSNSNESMTYGNYHKRQQENQAYGNFQKRIIKKTTELRTKRS